MKKLKEYFDFSMHFVGALLCVTIMMLSVFGFIIFCYFLVEGVKSSLKWFGI